MLTPLSEERYQRQKDELQALESIFGEDIVSAKIQNCWKQPCPLEITISLKPPFVDEVFVSVHLQVVCSSIYPEQSPTFYFHNAVEFSQKDLEELRQLLLQKTKENLGMEVIYELCHTTQEFLGRINRKPVSSMHEIMLKEKAQKEIKQRKDRADSETREIAAIDEENERRREELLNKKEQKDLERRNGIQMANFGKELGDCMVVELLPFGLDKKVEKKRIYKLLNMNSFRPSIHPMAVEWCAWSQFSSQILVTEWIFQYTLGRKGQRKLAASPDFGAFEEKLDQFILLFNRMQYSLQVDDQQFFTSYLFVNLTKQSTSPTNFNCRILIGQNVDEEDNCLGSESTIEAVKANSRRLVPQLAAQMVCALKWLHAQGFNHGHFCPYSIWLTTKKMFRMSDYYLIPHLTELCQEFDRLTNPTGCIGQKKADEKESLVKQQRRDLFCLGSLLDTILGPKQVSKCDESADSLDFSSSNLDAVDFIAACQMAKNVEQLAEHKYLIQDFRQPSNMSFDSDLIPGVGSLVDSRLAKEFQVVQWLGKGGFGDVYLARNKVDDNDYAVKRIPLDPKSERLNLKIKREAKLFSKLNHEHVVRYYSAWIENIPVGQEGTSFKGSSLLASSPTTDSPQGKQNMAKSKKLNTLSEGENGGGEWSESFQQVVSSNVSTDEDYLGANKQGKMWRRMAKEEGVNKGDAKSVIIQQAQIVQTLFSSRMANLSKSTAGHSEFDVVFEDGNESDEEESEQEDSHSVAQKSDLPKVTSTTTDENSLSIPRLHQILYIQMEYCKNSTLRNLIDTGRLHSDTSMIWRLFREILSGLQYIHNQNMIHRDIKPMNIFLDVNYSVKIGDFGLATRDLFVSQKSLGGAEETEGLKGRKSLPSDFTKNVGTMFYIAPELAAGQQPAKQEYAFATKIFSSKIDVYSVGIVLFEMFLEPPVTGTERFIIMQGLRSRLEFPESFGSKITQQNRNKAQKLIGQMLKTNPNERPSVDVLLQSDEIPLVTYEEDEFQKMFTQTLKKRKSRLYRWMFDSMLNNQPYDLAIDHCFDQKICKVFKSLTQEILVVEKIKKELQKVFELHAFVPLSTHLLVPLKNDQLKENDDVSKDELRLIATQQPCTLLHSSGLPLNLPVNLRQSFVRYCARNSVSTIKRYVFGQLYSPADSLGDHPTQRNECCVDVVGPLKQKLILAAEVIHLSMELVRKLTCLSGFKQTVGLGHAKLIQATCIHLGIGDKFTMVKVFNTLYFFTLAQNKKKLTHERKCINLVNRCGITQQMANSLLKLLEANRDFDDLNDQLRPLLRSKTLQVRELVREGLEEANKVVDFLQCFNENCQSVVFEPSLAYRPNTFFHGLTFLIKVELVGQDTSKSGIVLAGGSYEWCIEAERNAQEQASATPICAFGFNLPLENLANFHLKQSLDGAVQTCFALVCCTSAGLDKERCDLVRKLWNLNISADILHQPISSESQIHSKLELCRQNAISFLLLLMERDEVLVHADEDLSICNLPSFSRSYSGYRIAHKKISCEETIKMVVANAVEEPSSVNQSLAVRLAGEVSLGPESCGLVFATGTMANSFANVNINFAMDEKPPHNTKKKNEMQVRNSLSDLLSKLTPKTRVEVFVTDLQPDILKQLSSLLERRFTQTEFRQAFEVIFKQAGKYKADVDALLHSLSPFFSSSVSSSPVLVLWCRPVESFYRLIV